ncbi:transposase [Enterococcus sp. CWB-B31]|uniref:transposase n=1 Tax=Enterococcus sp. CWB-B31 TaxID=2885159 RepID=UPI001E2B6123|nr:transposase [Enterococcus sp. CWB-B31]MCB5955102.1 transposase [Enterococcus sp. CWB-B31]
MYAPIVKFSVEEKLFSVHQVLQSRLSTNAEAKRIGVANETLKDWIRKYEAGGVERLEELKTWTRYPEELKISAVKAVVDNAKSLNEVIETFSISSHSVLRQWISKYTSREDIKSTSKS